MEDRLPAANGKGIRVKEGVDGRRFPLPSRPDHAPARLDGAGGAVGFDRAGDARPVAGRVADVGARNRDRGTDAGPIGMMTNRPAEPAPGRPLPWRLQAK
jgi:hypothetical protein